MTTSATRRSPTVSSLTRPATTAGSTYWVTSAPLTGGASAAGAGALMSMPAMARPAASQWSTFSAFMSRCTIRPWSGRGAGTFTPMPPWVTRQAPLPCFSRSYRAPRLSPTPTRMTSRARPSTVGSPSSTKWSSRVASCTLFSGAGNSMPSPASAESIVIVRCPALTTISPRYGVLPDRRSARRPSAGAGAVRRMPSADSVPASVTRVLPSGVVPPPTASGAPRKSAPTPSRPKPWS